MTEEEIHQEIAACVQQHGPEEAKKILYARLATDPEFMAAAVKFGVEILQALHEAENTSTH